MISCRNSTLVRSVCPPCTPLQAISTIRYFSIPRGKPDRCKALEYKTPDLPWKTRQVRFGCWLSPSVIRKFRCPLQVAMPPGWKMGPWWQRVVYWHGGLWCTAWSCAERQTFCFLMLGERNRSPEWVGVYLAAVDALAAKKFGEAACINPHIP